MPAGVILFCVGATKAGTSWLHRWLEQHPGAAIRSIKEPHVFDTLETGRVAERLATLYAERAQLVRRSARAGRIQDMDDLIALFKSGAGVPDYLDYLTHGRNDGRLVADITPAYGLLPEARLREMATLGNTRFLYILRDPLARLWSHVRMIAARRDPDGAVTRARADRILSRVFNGQEEEIVRRSDYRGALERLSAAVPSGQRLAVYFEDIFGGTGLTRICQFLGLSVRPPLAEVIHGGQALTMDPAAARRARAWLDEQYTYVDLTIGHLPDAWRRTERV